MRANPGESTLVLTAESDLEREAMRRWAGLKVVSEDWLNSGAGAMFTLAFQPASPPPPIHDVARQSPPSIPAAGANVATSPARFRVGDRVKDRDGDCGQVMAVHEDVRLDVQYDNPVYGLVREVRATGDRFELLPPSATGDNVVTAPFFLNAIIARPSIQPKLGDPVRCWPGGAVGRVREVKPWGDDLLVMGEFGGDPRPEGRNCAVRFEFVPPAETRPSGDNVVTASGRRVRVPWPGQRVKVKSGNLRFDGTVSTIEIDPIPMMGDVWVHVASEGGWNDGAYPPEDVTISGNDHRWVEIVLPE